MLGKVKFHLGGRLVSQRAPLTTDSPNVIHPIGTALTPEDWGLFFKFYPFGSTVFCKNKVTSRRTWLFNTHRRI